MLEMCYPHHRASSSQRKGEQKPLKQGCYHDISDYNYKELGNLPIFRYHFQNRNREEFYEDWQRVLQSYKADHPSKEPLLDRPWKYVLESSYSNESNTSQLYNEAVARVETEARAAYIEEEIKCSKDEFVRVMTEQGCFILQIALCFLGGPKPLGYPPDDPLFGAKEWNYNVIRFLVTRYMFCVKNQIPLVALKVLMRQSFFQTVLKSGKWKKRPNDLARMALFDFLVEPILLDDPELKKQGNSPRIRRLVGFFHKRIRRWHQEQQPTTLLHALWLLVTGPAGSSHGRSKHHIEEEDDDDDESGHLCTTLSTIRSAMELQAAGINFKSEEGMGTRQIQFKKTVLEAYLYLPCFYMEPQTMVLFQNLIDYERAVGLEINRREVSAYVSLMKELIRSPDDVKLLVTQGIIDTNTEYEEQLPNALSELKPLEVGNNHNLIAIRRQIRRYVKPSIRTKIVNLVVIGVVLTLVQTIFSVLSYVQPVTHRG